MNERFINPRVELGGESWLSSDTEVWKNLLRALFTCRPGAGEAPDPRAPQPGAGGLQWKLTGPACICKISRAGFLAIAQR